MFCMLVIVWVTVVERVHGERLSATDHVNRNDQRARAEI